MYTYTHTVSILISYEYNLNFPFWIFIVVLFKAIWKYVLSFAFPFENILIRKKKNHPFFLVTENLHVISLTTRGSLHCQESQKPKGKGCLVWLRA